MQPDGFVNILSSSVKNRRLMFQAALDAMNFWNLMRPHSKSKLINIFSLHGRIRLPSISCYVRWHLSGAFKQLNILRLQINVYNVVTSSSYCPHHMVHNIWKRVCFKDCISNAFVNYWEIQYRAPGLSNSICFDQVVKQFDNVNVWIDLLIETTCIQSAYNSLVCLEWTLFVQAF